MSRSGGNRVVNSLLGLCFFVSMSCAGHLGSLVGGSGKGATQSTTSQDDAAAQNAEIQRNAARDQARTDAAQEKYRTGQEKRKQAEKDRVEKAREDKRQKVLEARSRADADPKSADAVDGYAKAVLDSDSLLRRDHAHSFDWSEQAEHAAGLTQKVASGVPGAQKKSHFYAQSGLLRERLDQKDEAVTAFERSLKENPGDLDVVESLLGLYANRKEPASASENLCKRTRRSVNGQENFYKLINLCVNMHPKRQEVSVPSGLAKLLPWVPAKELKQYKRWLGEGICKEDRMSECQSKCRCDPAQVVCSCKERCKTDANACMVPYLE